MGTEGESATLLYLRHVLEETGMSPSALAKSVGISSTTLTRPLNNPSYKFNLSTSTLEKIAKYTGISLAPFFENPDLASKTLALLKPGAYDPEIWKNPGTWMKLISLQSLLEGQDMAYGTKQGFI